MLILVEKISGWYIMKGSEVIDGPIMDDEEAVSKIEQLLGIEDEYCV